jgi:hypothetical protein
MTVLKRTAVLLVTVITMSGATELGEHLYVRGVPGFVSSAEAVVGRPLTPVSVAGVARRTGRRCATGVYNC